MYHPSNDLRGGFQDRDVGISHTDDFGPEYGQDFARYSDPTDPAADLALERKVAGLLHDLFHDEVSVKARNGFVFLRGIVRDDITRDIIVGAVADLPFVRQIINELKVEAAQ